MGMKKLLNATVTVIGAGGLGCPAIVMLASAGVGHIRIVDGDTVDLSNLPRQIMHFNSDIGKMKVQSIEEKIHADESRCDCWNFPSFMPMRIILLIFYR